MTARNDLLDYRQGEAQGRARGLRLAKAGMPAASRGGSEQPGATAERVRAEEIPLGLVSPGEKIHVIHRRRFDKDLRRHFVGEVERYENGVARARGYVFVIDDLSTHLFVKRPELRIKIVPMNSGELIVNVIPQAVNLDRVNYQLEGRSLRVTDGSDWSMDVKEFGWS